MKAQKLIQCSPKQCEMKKNCQRYTAAPKPNVARVIALNDRMGTADCPMLLMKEEYIEVVETPKVEEATERDSGEVEKATTPKHIKNKDA